MERKKPISVVAAVILRDNRVLIAQRPEGKHLAHKWEFPGGKVEKGETPEAALIRELREELACEIDVIAPLPRFIHRYETVTIEMLPFLTRLSVNSKEPIAREHIAICWVPKTQLSDYDLADADWPISDCLNLA
jgi:8-oxo-dGTP diphosphatase